MNTMRKGKGKQVMHSIKFSIAEIWILAPSRCFFIVSFTISRCRWIEEIEGKQTDLVTVQIKLEEHRQHEQLLKKENELLKVGKLGTIFYLLLRITQNKLVVTERILIFLLLTEGEC